MQTELRFPFIRTGYSVHGSAGVNEKLTLCPLPGGISDLSVAAWQSLDPSRGGLKAEENADQAVWVCYRTWESPSAPPAMKGLSSTLILREDGQDSAGWPRRVPAEGSEFGHGANLWLSRRNYFFFPAWDLWLQETTLLEM